MCSQCCLCQDALEGTDAFMLKCHVCGEHSLHSLCASDAFSRVIGRSVPSGPRRSDAFNRLRSNNYQGLPCARTKTCPGRIMHPREWLSHKTQAKPKPPKEAPAPAKRTRPPATSKSSPPLVIFKVSGIYPTPPWLSHASPQVSALHSGYSIDRDTIQGQVSTPTYYATHATRLWAPVSTFRE